MCSGEWESENKEESRHVFLRRSLKIAVFALLLAARFLFFGLVAQVSAKNEISALERADNEGGKKKRPRDVVLVSFATTSSYLPTGAQHTC